LPAEVTRTSQKLLASVQRNTMSGSRSVVHPVGLYQVAGERAYPIELADEAVKHAMKAEIR
jgi:hypothetical protein